MSAQSKSLDFDFELAIVCPHHHVPNRRNREWNAIHLLKGSAIRPTYCDIMKLQTIGMNFSSVLTWRVNLGICIVGAFLSFMPLMKGVVDSEDSRAFVDELLLSRFYRDAAISTLLITIPAGIDSLVDVILDSAEFLAKKVRGKVVSSSVRNLNRKETALRLSPVERLGFCIGIASLSIYAIITPSEGYSYKSVALYYSLLNFSTILSICPIIFFLERSTKIWTPLRSFLVILFINLGSVLGSVSYCFDIGSAEFFNITMTASALISAATLVLAIICGSCAKDLFVYLHRRRKTAFIRESWTRYILRTFTQFKGRRDFYNMNVPEIHTYALVVICITNVAWYFVGDDVVSISSVFMSIQTSVAVVIFVVEIRIRQNEVIRGLVSINVYIFLSSCVLVQLTSYPTWSRYHEHD